MRAVVASDGSVQSLHATARAAQLLDADTEFIVVAVAATPESAAVDVPVMASEHARTAMREEAEAALRATLDQLAQTQRQVTGRVEVGEPRAVICEAVQVERADVCVIGSHGRGPLRHFLLGSVSDYVVHHAGCPVLVVPFDVHDPHDKQTTDR